MNSKPLTQLCYLKKGEEVACQANSNGWFKPRYLLLTDAYQLADAEGDGAEPEVVPF